MVGCSGGNLNLLNSYQPVNIRTKKQKLPVAPLFQDTTSRKKFISIMKH